MSEPMGLERMTETLAQVEGYLTETRVPFLARATRAGNLKTDRTPGDLDVVGLAPAPDHDLLVAECKGYGSPEQYDNWLRPQMLAHLVDLVWGAAANIRELSHVRWSQEFAKRNHKPTVVWVVFPGHFMTGKSNPGNWEPVRGYEEFTEAMREPSRRAWRTWDGTRARSIERELLQIAGDYLRRRYELKEVRLMPVHDLVERLFDGVAQDMLVRRKRYPDSAAELIRWIARVSKAECLDLAEVQRRLRGGA